jgi:hypothetical protein
MLSWPDGLERGPRGARAKYRQIPEPFVWNSGLFISKTGTAFRKYYNSVSHEWSWSSDPLEPAEDIESGRMGLHVSGHWTPLETCIALAWRRRHPESTAPAIRDGKRRSLSASSVRWPMEEEGDDDGPINETWRPLSTRIGVVSTAGLGYQISSAGRLKNPSGDVTRGAWYRGRRWAAVRGAGLCDLDTAAGLSSGLQQPQFIQLSLSALMTGADAEDLAAEARVQIQTAWAYMNRAATIAPPDELRVVWKELVNRAIVRELKRMQHEKDPRLGGSLTALKEAMEERLQHSSSYFDMEEDDQWRHLRFARIALTRIGMTDPS